MRREYCSVLYGTVLNTRSAFADSRLGALVISRHTYYWRASGPEVTIRVEIHGGGTHREALRADRFLSFRPKYTWRRNSSSICTESTLISISEHWSCEFCDWRPTTGGFRRYLLLQGTRGRQMNAVDKGVWDLQVSECSPLFGGSEQCMVGRCTRSEDCARDIPAWSIFAILMSTRREFIRQERYGSSTFPLCSLVDPQAPPSPPASSVDLGTSLLSAIADFKTIAPFVAFGNGEGMVIFSRIIPRSGRFPGKFRIGYRQLGILALVLYYRRKPIRASV